MSDFDELSFVIPGYTPDTMPLNRLIEYLNQMSIIIGEPTNLHLVAILKSSVNPVLRAPRETVLEAKQTVARVQRGEGTPRQSEANNRIRRMVRDDTAGTLYSGKPALIKANDNIILEIPAAPEEIGIINGVRQVTSIDGQVIRVGGAGKDASIQLKAIDGRLIPKISTKKELAKELAQLLWGPTVRLNGIGIWDRDAFGIWNLSGMQVQSYEQLEEDNAISALEHLRSLNVSWPKDAWDRLREEREGHP